MSNRHPRHLLKSVNAWAKRAYKTLQSPIPEALHELFLRKLQNKKITSDQKNHPSLLQELRLHQESLSNHEIKAPSTEKDSLPSSKEAPEETPSAEPSVPQRTEKDIRPSEVPPSISQLKFERHPDIPAETKKRKKASVLASFKKAALSLKQQSQTHAKRTLKYLRQYKEDASLPPSLKQRSPYPRSFDKNITPQTQKSFENTETAIQSQQSQATITLSPAEMPASLKKQVRRKRAGSTTPPTYSSLIKGLNQGIQKFISTKVSPLFKRKSKSTPIKTPPVTPTTTEASSTPSSPEPGNDRDKRWQLFMRKVRKKAADKQASADESAKESPQDKIKKKITFKLPKFKLPSLPKKAKKTPEKKLPLPTPVATPQSSTEKSIEPKQTAQTEKQEQVTPQKPAPFQVPPLPPSSLNKPEEKQEKPSVQEALKSFQAQKKTSIEKDVKAKPKKKFSLPKLSFKKKAKPPTQKLPGSVEEIINQEPAFKPKKTLKPAWLKAPNKKPAAAKTKPKKTPKPVIKKQPKLKTGFHPFRQKFAIGIDIGNTHIRWAQLGRQGNKNVIIQLGQEPLPYPRVKGIDPLGKILKTTAKLNHLKGPVVMALPAQEATFRLLNMPVLPASEMIEAIRWQLEPELPPHIAYDELVVDYRIIGDDSEQWKARILIATVPKQAVETRLKLAEEAGLKPIALDLEPFANELTLTWKDQLSKSGKQLLIQLGAENASFSVAVDGQIIYCRSTRLNGEQLTKAISEATQTNRDQAEQLKQTYGLTYFHGLDIQNKPPESPQAVAVAQALALQLDRALIEFMQSFQGFASEATHNKIDSFNQVWVAGNGANLPGLNAWLQQRLSVPTHRVNPLANEPTPILGVGTKSTEELSSAFSIALGLALRESIVPENLSKAKRYNFIPSKKSATHRGSIAGNRLTKLAKPVMAVAVAAILFIGTTQALRQVSLMRNMKKDIKQTLRVKEQLAMQASQLRTELESQHTQILAEKDFLEERHRRLLRAQQNPVPLSMVLEKLGSFVPKDVWITKLTFNGDSLKIAGASKTTTAVSLLMNQLELSKQFRNTTFSYTQRAEEKDNKEETRAISTFTFEISTTPVLAYSRGAQS